MDVVFAIKHRWDCQMVMAFMTQGKYGEKPIHAYKMKCLNCGKAYKVNYGHCNSKPYCRWIDALTYCRGMIRCLIVTR